MTTVRRKYGKGGPSWLDIFGAWPQLEADFQHFYHLDLSTCLDRPWRWFEVRVAGVICRPDSLLRATVVTEEGGEDGSVSG